MLFELHKLSLYSSKTAVTATTAVYSTIITYVVRTAQVVSLFLKDGCDRNNSRLYESDVLFQYMTNRYAHHRQHTRFISPDIKKDEADISVRLVLKRYLFVRAEAL